jgi:glycosyltransferase involved in cell wall biosynthesis
LTASVVIVAPWGERLGGAEEMLWQLLRNLDRQRLEPSVVFLGPGPFEREVAELGVWTRVIPAGRLRRPLATGTAIRLLAAVLREREPGLLLNWSAKCQLYGSVAATLAGMRGRVAWWQHQIPAGHWVDQLATLSPARAIGCSSAAGETAQRALRPSRPTFVVNPGIEIDPGPAGANGLRDELGIPRERLVAGIVGRLQPWKGQDRFLAALAQMRERGRDVHGIVVGGDAYGLSPEYAVGLERLIAQLGLEGHVTMTGQVADSRPYIELMDVAVNASDNEPFGIVLLEAMAAGVPVVAVAKGGPADIVEPGVTGMLSASREPQALAAAIEAVIVDPERRAAMGAEGRRRCEERYSAKAMAERVVAQLLPITDG